jgi:hypothetical protein
MSELKGGTTGQVLSKTSNTDMDFTWVAQDDSNAIQNAIVDAKGDLIAATAADTPARLAVGTDGQVLTADSSAATGLAWATASAGSTNVAGKNGALNSQFNVWQRGTSVTGAGGGAYTADRWFLYAGSQATVSRQATGDTTNLPFIQYCARVQRNSGVTDTSGIPLSQSFETVNSLQYAGKTVTFSFYARRGANYSATSNALSVYLITGTGTDQNQQVSGYTGQALPINGVTATLTTTWQRFTYTATLSSTMTELSLNLTFSPTGTAGAADYFEVTGVQLEIAGSASAYSPNTSTYQVELAACQRYFKRFTAGQNFTRFAVGQNISSTQAGFVIPFGNRMRVTPSFACSAGDWDTVEGTSSRGTVAPTLSSDGNGLDSAWINTVISSGNTGYAVQLRSRGVTTTYLEFSAEL